MGHDLSQRADLRAARAHSWGEARCSLRRLLVAHSEVGEETREEIVIDPAKPKAMATRGDGLYLVPSQRTERIQAIDPPSAVWPTDLTLVERGSLLWEEISSEPLFWKIVGLFFVAAVFCVWLIATNAVLR